MAELEVIPVELLIRVLEELHEDEVVSEPRSEADIEEL